MHSLLSLCSWREDCFVLECRIRRIFMYASTYHGHVLSLCLSLFIPGSHRVYQRTPSKTLKGNGSRSRHERRGYQRSNCRGSRVVGEHPRIVRVWCSFLDGGAWGGCIKMHLALKIPRPSCGTRRENRCKKFGKKDVIYLAGEWRTRE